MSTPEEVQEVSPDQRVQDAGEQVIAFLNGKWGADPQCPMCHTDTWHMLPPMVLVPIPGYQPTQFGSVPVFPVACANCGNTLLVNGVLAGVFNPRVPEEAGES